MMRWFKHLSQARSDEKISAFVAENGLEGYGFWWLMLEILANKLEKNSIHAEVTYHFKEWPKMCGLSSRKFIKMCSSSAHHGLMIEKIEGQYLTIEIPNLLKYRDEYQSRVGR